VPISSLRRLKRSAKTPLKSEKASCGNEPANDTGADRKGGCQIADQPSLSDDLHPCADAREKDLTRRAGSSDAGVR
jgi:hypothetical protein